MVQQPQAGQQPQPQQPQPSRTSATMVQPRVYVVQQATPETIGIDNIRKTAAGYFSAAGKVGALLGAVKPEEIVVAKRTAVFRPYWRIVGGHAYRFSRVHNHAFRVEHDVESVEVFGQTITITPDKQLEQMIMESASKATDEYGATEGLGETAPDMRTRATAVATGTPVTSREGEVDLQNVKENVVYMYVGKFVFDAVSGTESKETYDLLKDKDMVPIDEDALRGTGTLIPPTFSREQLINEVSTRLSRRPKDMQGEPTEHQFVVGELSLIYLPYYEFTFEYKDKTRTARLDGATGKMEET